MTISISLIHSDTVFSFLLPYSSKPWKSLKKFFIYFL